MFINQSRRTAERMIPVFHLTKQAEAADPFEKPHTHFRVSIYHNKDRSCYILSISPCVQKDNGCVSTVLDPTPGYSYYGNIKPTKRYNVKELDQLAQDFDENYVVNPIILNLLKFHKLSLNPVNSVNPVNTVTEVTNTPTNHRTSEKDGEKLSQFKKGDTVFRNYDGRYEEYEIICTKKYIWKLKEKSGYISNWNADANGGFMLLTNSSTEAPAPPENISPIDPISPITTTQAPSTNNQAPAEPTNILHFPNPITKLLTTPIISRFLKA